MSNRSLVIYGELIPNGTVVLCDGPEGALVAIYQDYPLDGSPATRLAARHRIADHVAADARIDAICDAEADPTRHWRLADQPLTVRRLLDRPARMGAIAGVPAVYGPNQPRLVLAAHLVVREPASDRGVILVDGSTAESLLASLVRLKLMRVEPLLPSRKARR